MADGAPKDSRGLATAIALAGAFREAPSDTQQTELFADALDDAPSSLTPARSGPKGGRPVGARNRSTEEWRKLVLSRYQSPMIGLAETWSRTADELARELYLTTIKARLAPGEEAIETYTDDDGNRRYLTWDRRAAFEIQQSARAVAMPYLHQKQPLAIEPKGKGNLGILVLGDFMAEAEAETEGLPVIDAEAEDVTPGKGGGA